MENRERERFLSAIETIKNNLDGKDISAVRTFLVWLKKYLEVNASIEEAQKGVRTIRTTKEATSMLAKTIEEVKKDFLQQGIQLGIQQGIQQGSKNALIETAKKMLSIKYSIKEITAVTGLKRSEVEKLRK